VIRKIKAASIRELLGIFIVAMVVEAIDAQQQDIRHHSLPPLGPRGAAHPFSGTNLMSKASVF
jgi:hypothetical protein